MCLAVGARMKSGQRRIREVSVVHLSEHASGRLMRGPELRMDRARVDNPNGRSEHLEEAQDLRIGINWDGWGNYGCGMA